MKIYFKILLSAVFIILSSSVFAQIDDDLLEEDTLNLSTSSLPELEAAKKEIKETKKAKKKKNTFFGIKTKKTFLKNVNSQRIVVETFSYMKVYTNPNPYIKEIFWYDKKKHRIRTDKKVDKASWRLLHGPYYRTVNGKMTDTGFYFMGCRHGRWEKYASNGHLLDKIHYHKGWLKHSEITYFDASATKIKEVIPIHHGKKTGDYFLFYENGQIATEGRYDHNVKVGKWIEYYSNKIKKREIQNAVDPNDDTFKAYTLREWGEDGKPTLDLEKEVATIESKPDISTKEIEPQKVAKKSTDVKEKKIAVEEEIEPELPKKVIDKSRISETAIVKLREKKDGATEKYKIVPDGEGDMKKRKISVGSNIGKALLGKKAGEIAKIKLTAGIVEFEILEITYP